MTAQDVGAFAGRVIVAVFIGLPLVTIANVLVYWMTYFSLTIMFGCFAPAWAIEGLALMQFCAAMLYSLTSLGQLVLFGPDEMGRSL
jgi:hypothetical protein